METLMPREAVPHYGLQAVNRLRALKNARSEAALVTLCIGGIREFIDRWDHFQANTTVTAEFQEEFLRRLRDCRPEAGLPDEEIGDSVFAMFECLAAIFREDHLKQPTRQLPPAQASLMQFFEECGEWNKGDGTSVTDHYFFIIPNAAAAWAPDASFAAEKA